MDNVKERLASEFEMTKLGKPNIFPWSRIGLRSGRNMDSSKEIHQRPSPQVRDGELQSAQSPHEYERESKSRYEF